VDTDVGRSALRVPTREAHEHPVAPPAVRPTDPASGTPREPADGPADGWGDRPGDRPSKGGLPPDLRTALALDLLRTYPDAQVSAIAETGQFVAVPAEVPLDRHAVLTGPTSSVGLVVAEDAGLVMSAWSRALAEGAAVAEARPVSDPDGQLVLYLIDTRERYGVLLALVVRPTDSPGARADSADPGDRAGSRRGRNPWRPRRTVLLATGAGRLLQADDVFPTLLGRDRDDVAGQSILDLAHRDDHARAVDLLIAATSLAPTAVRAVVEPAGHSGPGARLRLRHADGRWRWFDVTVGPSTGSSCLSVELIDISDEVEAQDALRTSRQFLTRLTDGLPVGVAQIDGDGRVVYTNSRAVQVLGVPAAAAVSHLFARVDAGDRAVLRDAVDEVLAHGDDVDLEVNVRHSERVRRCRLNLRPLRADDDGDGAAVTGAILCIDDVTDRAWLRAQLDLSNTYDELTGCLNRAAVLGELDRALEAAELDGTGVAAVFIDLDGFKELNDTFGHDVGDALLQSVGQHLTAAARRGDIVGRVGDDEFVIVGRGVPSAAHAFAIAQRMAEALAANVSPQPQRRAVGSLGVAWAFGRTQPLPTADQLIARADEAMSVSKREGIGRPVLG
jgi:diguanylate cyclase (GGDEF)-like protein